MLLMLAEFGLLWSVNSTSRCPFLMTKYPIKMKGVETANMTRPKIFFLIFFFFSLGYTAVFTVFELEEATINLL